MILGTSGHLCTVVRDPYLEASVASGMIGDFEAR